VSEVFSTDKEREGAYDLLENEHFGHEALMESMACSTAARCRALPFVYVPIDGMGLSLVDRRGKKNFGAIGTPRAGRRTGRGLKVIDALAIDPKGTPIGWLAQRYWARTVEPGARPPKRSFARAALPVEQKETWHWIQVIRAASSKLDAEGVRGWFQLDREGDAHAVLLELARNSHWWTVRNRSNRTIQLNQERAVSRLRDQLMRQRPQGSYALEVSGKWKRRARQANMVVRVGRVTLLLRNQGKPHTITPLPVTAVWTREKGTTPAGEKPIDWMLLTNREVTSLEHAREVIAGYAARWRVEECHKTWKSDACNIENTQLRSASAVMKWATILAAVAARIERLKRLARTEPEAPSTVELTPIEVQALVLLKRRYRNTDDKICDHPNIEQAVLWIAQLGGYTGKSSGGPPGALTIRRGLDRLDAAAAMLQALADEQK
jgi:Transposase Tn5 dimerisation domain